ncbi:MAG: hypothetical protein ACP5GL_07505 [Infirmifilum sp.]
MIENRAKVKIEPEKLFRIVLTSKGDKLMLVIVLNGIKYSYPIDPGAWEFLEGMVNGKY